MIYTERKSYLKAWKKKIKVKPVIPHEACHRTKAFSPKINNNNILFLSFFI